MDLMNLLKDLKNSPPRLESDDPNVLYYYEVSEWAAQNWHIPFGAVTIYYIISTILPFFISKPIKSRPILFLWNATLGVTSFAGWVYYSYGLYMFVSENGLKALVCEDLYIILEKNSPCLHVAYFFMWSKFAELGDTFWLILGQRPVIFLHWYHHMTVLVYTWLGMVQHVGMGHVFIWFNLFVHSIMYTYYACTQNSTLKKMVAPIAPYITAIQLTQMVGGIIFTLLGIYWSNLDGEECSVKTANSVCAVTMYFSYFVLFYQFYQRRFKSKKKKA